MGPEVRVQTQILGNAIQFAVVLPRIGLRCAAQHLVRTGARQGGLAICRGASALELAHPCFHFSVVDPSSLVYMGSATFLMTGP